MAQKVLPPGKELARLVTECHGELPDQCFSNILPNTELGFPPLRHQISLVHFPPIHLTKERRGGKHKTEAGDFHCGLQCACAHNPWSLRTECMQSRRNSYSER